MKLMVIFGSSRQGRKGEVVANWVKNHAQQDSRLEVDYVDCRDLNLPFFDEPLSPFSMKRQGVEYTHPEGRAWADRVGKVDGAIIITPEYNHGYPAVLKNALDWVGPEWNYKPVGFVSYGGVSGGSRVVEQLRTVTIELGLVQVANPIHFPFFEHAFDENGQPVRPDYNDKLKSMFDELTKLHDLLVHLRTS
jgi:NAD(P)H-dependent FMN reductase